ncbi:MAG: lysozyme [Myxococcota bacterium]|nr:lysozyme [Myxococcota bacterium]
MFADRFKEHLEWAEGRRLFPYEDSVGKLTVGVGRNLDDRGLRESEVTFLLQNDIAEVLDECQRLPYWDELNEPRRMVVADMVFNLGFSRFLGFIKTNEALAKLDYHEAAKEMRDSRWFRQVGRRARKLVRMMQSGVWDA